MQAVTEETCEPEPVTAADDFKIDYKAAARDALNRMQQELVTEEIEQKVKLELENEKLQEKLNTFEATEVEETKAPSWELRGSLWTVSSDAEHRWNQHLH